MGSNSESDLQRATVKDGDGTQVLTFLLAGEEYAVDILRVQEIRGWAKATEIPNTPAYIKGVINLRGTIVPIVDLRERFRMQHVAYGPTTVVVVLKVMTGDRGRTVGVVVDAVSDVYNLAGTELKPPPDFGGGIDTEFLKGLATINDRMLIMLNVDTLLETAEIGGLSGASN